LLTAVETKRVGLGFPLSGWMIVIKPTLTGDEPADVLHCYGQHPTFRHESTADQWFDELQWESYRKLGEHIATKLFESNDADGAISEL
jgi:hypothetical protein